MKKQLLPFLMALAGSAVAPAQTPELGIPVGHNGRIYSVDFSPDGKYAVSGSADKSIRLWDVASGRVLKLWEPYQAEIGPAPVCGVGFGRDGKFIVEGAQVPGKSLQCYEIGRQDMGSYRVFLDPTVQVLGLQPSVRALCVTDDGDAVLTLTSTNDLKFWNIKNQKLLQTFPTQPEQISALCTTPDGRWAYAGHKDGSIRRWDLKKGEPDLLFKNVQDGAVKSIDVSPNGELLLAASSNGSLKLLKTSDLNAAPVFVFKDSDVLGNGKGAVFSQDGKTIAYANSEYEILIWDVATMQQTAKLTGHRHGVTALRFSPDGLKLMSGDAGKMLIIWDLPEKKPLHLLEGNTLAIQQVFFTQNKKNLVTVAESRNTIVSWNSLAGKVDKVFKGHQSEVIATCVSPNGRFLLTSGKDHQVILWDFETAEKLGELTSKSDLVTSLAISPNNKFALTGTAEHLVVLWDLEAKNPMKTFNGHKDKVTSVSFSPDNKWAMSASDDNAVNVYDVELRQQTNTVAGQASRVTPVAFSPDGKSFLSMSFSRFVVEWWDISSKKIKKTFPLQNGPDAKSPDLMYSTSFATLAFSPLGDRFLLSSGNDVLLWDLSKEKPAFLHGHQSAVRSVSFSSDGKLAMSAGDDGSIRLWDGRTGKALCTVLQLGGADWAAVTPEGLFDGSPNALAQLYFVVGLETIELEQMKDRYYEPGMVPILLGLQLGTLREVPPLSDTELFPELTAEIKKGILVIDLKKRRGGGYGKVVVAVNGTNVLPDACNGSGSCKYDIADFKPHFFTGKTAENTIAVRVYNETGWLKSSPIILHPFAKSRGDADDFDDGVFELPGGAPPPPSFYAIVVGTSKYGSESLSLGFPDKDAHAMDTTLRVIARGTEFFENRVNVTLLTTDATDPELLPSKKNIREAFRKMEATKPEDVLLVYFSGHGMTYLDGSREDFYYLTKDVKDSNLSNDPGLRNAICVSADSMNAWLSAIPAKKRVMIFDACHSGKAAEALNGKAPLSSQKRELERLRDSNGTFVLAGCEANQLSYEDPNSLKQGLLTYSLLYGLQSRQATLDGAVDVMTLFQFALSDVPNLAKDINHYQKPVLTVPGGEAPSFSIGWVNPDTKIILDRKNQFVMQSMFLNKEGFNDDMALSVALDQRLEEGNIEGYLGKMIFANTRQLSDACAIRGLYSLKNGKVRLEGKVFLPGDTSKLFLIENADEKDVTGLVDKVILEVNKQLEKTVR